MAKSQRVGGLRTAGQGNASPEGESNLTPSKRFKHEFQSSKAALILSLAERIVHWGPNGGFREQFPKTSGGSRTDMIRFEDSYFGTNDDELAERLKDCKDEKDQPVCKLGGLFWDMSEMRHLQRESEVAAMRERLAQDPELAKLVLKPSDAEDFSLPPTA